MARHRCQYTHTHIYKAQAQPTHDSENSKTCHTRKLMLYFQLSFPVCSDSVSERERDREFLHKSIPLHHQQSSHQKRYTADHRVLKQPKHIRHTIHTTHAKLFLWNIEHTNKKPPRNTRLTTLYIKTTTANCSQTHTQNTTCCIPFTQHTHKQKAHPSQNTHTSTHKAVSREHQAAAAAASSLRALRAVLFRTLTNEDRQTACSLAHSTH